MYQALYRKYRPLYFSDVVGQDVIIKTLQNSIINKNYGHAYLFYGSRGTGKTSVSKILARTLNCLDPKDGEACGKCDSCKQTFDNDCVDIIEMDAASNNGVDEIRRIIDTLNLSPNSLKYKVYIVDEVHMLSTGAFNALLKTLEEPPEHVIFILATTELQKVPSTIISRCQVFSFKRIPIDIIINKLKSICKKEKIKIEDNILYNIANASNGGMRDSLSMLDKLFSYAGNEITMNDYYELNEIISEDDIVNLSNSILAGDVSNFINKLNEYDSMGKNLILIINQMVNYLRNNVINHYINKQDNNFNLSLIIKLNLLFIENMFDIKKSDNPKIFIEMLVVKFINDNGLVEKEDSEVVKIEKKTEEMKELPKNVEIEKKIEDPTKIVEKEKKKVKKTLVDKRILNIDEIMNIRFINTLITAKKTIKNEEIKNFEKLKSMSFDSTEGYFANNLLDGVVQCANDECVVISFDHDAIVRQNLIDIEKLMKFYKKVTKSDKKLCLIGLEKWNSESKKFMEAYKNKNIDDIYHIEEEPKPIYEEDKKDDIIGSSAMNLFDSDIVEME